MVYPTSMLAKRWAEGETGTLVWLAQATIKTVVRYRATSHVTGPSAVAATALTDRRPAVGRRR